MELITLLVVTKINGRSITKYTARPDIQRSRQYYLSIDIDFERIKTNKKWVKGVLTFLNFVKLPAPAVSLSNGKLSGNWLYF